MTQNETEEHIQIIGCEVHNYVNNLFRGRNSEIGGFERMPCKTEMKSNGNVNENRSTVRIKFSSKELDQLEYF
jgi:hypothetical protein